MDKPKLEFVSPPSQDLFFSGRQGDPRLGGWVRPWAPHADKSSLEDFTIWGCPDDRGIQVNLGRPGAKDGPDSIRKHFYKMTLPMDQPWEERLQLFDAGNLIPANDLSSTHERCRTVTQTLGESSCTLIALGGGHDFAAPNFAGFAAGIGTPLNAHGLINIDPHLDVRPVEPAPHSGTPFRVLLENRSLSPKNFVEFGIRSNRNARSHFEYCEKKKIEIQTFDEIRAGKRSAQETFSLTLSRLSRPLKWVGVTFDMDACSEAEGTSAAPTLGFSAWEMCHMAYAAGKDPKVRFLEIAEVSPILDPSERSSRIASEILFCFLKGRFETLAKKKKKSR